ncbi:DNA replication complex GINS family protein [Candidatus Pacearchaeota archaeon]|nr:DNA replication complex GINS family protein [Candidatus Pacearchaeota archaeon]
MITFNDIYESARKERITKELQKLSENFVSDVADYFKGKKGIASKENELFSDVIAKNQKQLENARTLFKELIVIRRKKILNLILIAAEIGISKRDFENMMEFEKNLFNEMMSCIENSNRKISSVLENGGNINVMDLLFFKEDVAEFVGLNGEKTGPFKKGQKVSVPKEIAKILIEDGKAKLVEKI